MAKKPKKTEVPARLPFQVPDPPTVQAPEINLAAKAKLPLDFSKVGVRAGVIAAVALQIKEMKSEQLSKIPLDDLEETLPSANQDDEDAKPVYKHSTDDVVLMILAAADLDDQIKAAQKVSSLFWDRIEVALVNRFIALEQDGVKRGGKNVFLSSTYRPSYKYTDLLPEGVDENDPNYAKTVATVREAAKDRLIQALKKDPALAFLVEENYNANSLRSALTGDDAEKDELDTPILPESVKDLVELNPKTTISIRKA